MQWSIRVTDVSLGTSTTATNWIILHIKFIRATLLLLLVKCPGIHKSVLRTVKGGTNWPWEYHFLAASSSLIGEHIMWMLFHPIYDICSYTWSKEPYFQTVKCFVFYHITSDRLIVHQIKKNTAERKRNNNATHVVGRNSNGTKIKKSTIEYKFYAIVLRYVTMNFTITSWFNGVLWDQRSINTFVLWLVS